jgi:hypothetical protein
MLPPGRAMLATNPEAIGSTTPAKTIGIVRVSRWYPGCGGVRSDPPPDRGCCIIGQRLLATVDFSNAFDNSSQLWHARAAVGTRA